MKIFDEVKYAINIREVAENYGIHVDRSGSCICPFHDERTASLKIYESTNSFYCFGCHAGGDVINFVGKLFGLSNLDAAKKLNEDFNLGINTTRSKETYKQEISEAQRKRAERQAYEKWENSAFIVLSNFFHKLRDWSEEFAPKTPEEMTDIRYIESCKHLSYAEELCIEFINAAGDSEDGLSDKDIRLAMQPQIKWAAQKLEAYGKYDREHPLKAKSSEKVFGRKQLTQERIKANSRVTPDRSTRSKQQAEKKTPLR